MKKFLMSVLSIIFIIFIFTNVYAATGTINSGSSVDTVIKGNTFEVTLVGTADSPIDGMYTKFSYDKNVLIIESVSAGKNYGDNSGEGEILVVSSASESPTSATLYTIKFKVLDIADADTTTISFSESALHLNEENTVKDTEVTIEDVVVNIKEDDTTAGNQGGQDGEEQPPVEQPENNSVDGNNSSNGNNTNGNNSSNSGNKNTNKKPSKLPQTGLESTGIIALISIVVVSIISFISYNKYRNI